MAEFTGQPLPPAFLERMRHWLGAEFPAFLASYAQPATSGLRVNSLKLHPTEFLPLSPFPLNPLPWCPAGFSLPEQPGMTTPGKHPYHAAGLYYLQDPSAMAAAGLLAPRPGEQVLDLAAAPGGKTTHLAALMLNQGWLVANEIHPRRVWDLAENLERCGVRNATITNETPGRLAEYFGPFFDRVLLDAPCSGEGMFRKYETARSEWKPELVNSCALRQSAILEEAARMVKQGGVLAYTTCTFAPEENEAVIARFLENHPNFFLESGALFPGFAPGRPEWVAQGPLLLSQAVRLWPHKLVGEGHFITLLRKQPAASDHATLEPAPLVPVPKAVHQLFTDFCKQNLHIQLDHTRLSLHGSYLYLLPEQSPELPNLHVIHPGWWLGTLKNNRFEPAHALAIGLMASQALRAEKLNLEDSRLGAYLRGEVISVQTANPAAHGWGLVCVEDYPLGWGKWVQGKIKNAYPRGLRWH